MSSRARPKGILWLVLSRLKTGVMGASGLVGAEAARFCLARPQSNRNGRRPAILGGRTRGLTECLVVHGWASISNPINLASKRTYFALTTHDEGKLKMVS